MKRIYEYVCTFYRGCCLDDGDFIDYALLTGSPSICWWMIPRTWKEWD